MGPTVRELCPGVRWFALTVKHQHEQRVEDALSASGVEAFLPLYRVRRRWSDRVKDLDVPLFPGYVFGRFSDVDRIRILRTPGVAKIVGFAGIPAPVPENELDAIRLALASRLPLGPWPFLKTGSRVRVEDGPLRGLEGRLLREREGLRLVVGIELLQRSLAIEIDSGMISPLN